MINTKSFALAGNAIFTATSKRTGTRFTYKVRASKNGNCHWVSLLNGPNNENDYRYFGTIFEKSTFRHATPDKTPISPTAPSAIAFNWLWRNLDNPANLSKVEITHEGKCCRCGRKLTVPSSVESGIGPECAAYMGM